MMYISVVIPIFNRRDEIRLCLTALSNQSEGNFEVIVADDGSSDSPLDILERFKGAFPMYYVRQEHLGFRAAAARNLGAKLARGSALVFIDSDVLLNPTAIGHYYNLHKENPDAIIGGRYDWLPPMQIHVEDVIYRFDQIAEVKLPALHIEGRPLGIQGPDPRASNPNFFDHTKVRKRYALSLYSGNMLVPAKIYREMGGFDGSIVGHGGEDCDFAIRAQLADVPVIFSEEVVGYHVYHWRDQAKNTREVLENVEYISERHDLDALGIRRGDIEAGEYPLVYKNGAEEYV